ncbi:hypothetical protein F7725_015341 [Dissostichus mawsoni]|uniref:Uncharacterized protein n=1 Tax=Dissostichus mawsoni TaxID=36200 RepID=A0A7J5YH87_DISMA|nr:hypothetical protein F7725_015341 [Dissostichus mawsoni]
MVWEAAQTADSVANDDDHDEGKRARDENFFDTVEAMEDRRAVVKESMHGDQMGLLSKAQETEDKMLTMMERQAEVLTRQMERQDEVSAQRHERQDELTERRQERRQDGARTARMNCRSGARAAPGPPG